MVIAPPPIRLIQVSVGGFDNNFTYIIHAEDSKEAILIDPTGDLEQIEIALKKNNLKSVMQLFTHAHSDHVELKKHFISKGLKTYEPKEGKIGEIDVIEIANLKITALHTPGHTKESVCFLIENNLFSGDTLFVKGVGTTAYGGNDADLNESLMFLSVLNPGLNLWPGHDYGGAFSSLGTALKNSHIKPGKNVHDKIKKRIEEYRNQNANFARNESKEK